MAAKKEGVSKEVQEIIAKYILDSKKVPDSTLKNNPEWEAQLVPYSDFLKAIFPYLDVDHLLFQQDK